MTGNIKTGSTGTQLTILDSQNYNAWLEEQDAIVQNWLQSSGFRGEGLSLIPATDGSISKVVFAGDLSDFFATAELANKLPQGEYLLDVADDELQSNIAIAWGLGSYRFTRYLKTDAEKTAPILVLKDNTLVQSAQKFIDAVYLVRDLVNTPAGDMMPEHLSEAAQALAKQFGAQFSEIVGDELLKENYPIIHAVGRASIHQPRLLDFTWGDEKHPKVTLVGKGVCFDSGGLDLKPGVAMRLMKKDMGGSAHVLGLASLIMSHQLPVRLRVMIPAVENAVSSNAFRPGDVLTTRKGLTVEVDNTDAEGRLVLCDALAEADTDKPELIIDFATLTGACRIALGTELPGFFTNNSKLVPSLFEAGETSDDPIWNLPLHKPYRDMLKSDIADLQNCAPSPFGGAITAALYLNEFVSADVDWVHFDVMAWNQRKLPGRPVGGEAMGIRAVFQYLTDRYC